MFQRCFINVETTSINIRRLNFHFQPNFNVETTLVHLCWVNVILSMLFQLSFAYVEITSINEHRLILSFSSKYPRWNDADERWRSTLNQRCVDRQRSSTLFQRWYFVENESWADVHFSTLCQCWQNNTESTPIKTTSIQRRLLNVVSTLIFGWKWKLSRRMFTDVVSTFTKQR